MNPQTSNGTVKLMLNQPETLALSFPVGKLVTSQYGGDQLMFSTDCGRRIYLPPFVGEKIHAAEIAAHEPFEICKREVVNGNRRSVEYQISKPSAQAGTVNAVPARKEPATATTSQATTPLPDSNAFATDEAMKRAGFAAVDAVLAIEAYARSRGMQDFEFGADNIQRLAATIYIDGGKNGRRS